MTAPSLLLSLTPYPMFAPTARLRMVGVATRPNARRVHRTPRSHSLDVGDIYPYVIYLHPFCALTFIRSILLV